MSAQLKKFYFGICYYPEAWDPSRHASDIDRIADAGFNYVRMGESAWSYWEPEEGRYQFDLFDRVIELCRGRGIDVILGTPTYACPAWVATNYPEVLRWNFQRIPMKHGSRRNLNYTSPKMLELSDRICTALADHYENDPQILGWQLDNEFNCHMDVSYAPSDTAAFRNWLQQRYRTLETLNLSWGTRFWSQTYSAWDQIELPHPTATYLNPSQLLDESRFISDCVIRFAKRQADILRARNENWFITHNGLFSNVDGPALAGELDFFSQDVYPLFFKGWPEANEQLLLARSLSFPYAIMEQQSGPGGQMEYLLRTPRPGEMRLWTFGSVVHGANMLSYFRWRTCPYGTEQHWHGLLDADDRDNRRLSEARLTGTELANLPAEFFAAVPERTVAVLCDFDNEINDRRIDTYIGTGRSDRKRWANEFQRRHVSLDLIWPNSDLTGYKLLVVPHLKIADPALVAKLTGFVTTGGVLLLGAQSGLKNLNNHMAESTPPGLLAELAGVEVEDWTSLPAEQTRQAMLDSSESVHLSTFVERLRPRAAEVAAEVVAVWKETDTLLQDFPAMTCNRIGNGRVYYLGGYCPDAAVVTLCGWLIHTLDLPHPIDAPPEVEVMIRQTQVERQVGRQGGRFVCLLNHDQADHVVHGVPSGTDLISGKNISSRTVTLAPLSVTIIRTARDARL